MANTMIRIFVPDRGVAYIIIYFNIYTEVSVTCQPSYFEDEMLLVFCYGAKIENRTSKQFKMLISGR